MLLDDMLAEIVAAQAALAPKVRGLEDLQHVSLSPESKQAVGQTLDTHARRRDMLLAVNDTLTRLAADGYPELPKTAVMSGVYDELQVQRADIDEAVAEFEQEPIATALSIALGEPADKPTE